MQDDDLGMKVPDGDLEGLASQNAYLQEALETCRKEIAGMSQQAGPRFISLKPFCGLCVLQCHNVPESPDIASALLCQSEPLATGSSTGDSTVPEFN